MPECVEQPTPLPGADARVTVQIELTYGGSPVVFGEPFPLATGTLTLTNFRFYVSEVALVRPSGEDVPVDIVNGDGSPASYRMHLVNAEESSEMSFELAGPSGDYDGISFLVGIPDACNGSASGRNPPLTATSQMTWPPPFGYLFLRYAGMAAGKPATDTTPTIIDMGGFPNHIFAPRVVARGSLSLGAPRIVRLRVALDELFRSAALPVNLDDYGSALTSAPVPTGAAQLAGQHVLQNIAAVAAFTVGD